MTIVETWDPNDPNNKHHCGYCGFVMTGGQPGSCGKCGSRNIKHLPTITVVHGEDCAFYKSREAVACDCSADTQSGNSE
jgi:hypothetical protein